MLKTRIITAGISSAIVLGRVGAVHLEVSRPVANRGRSDYAGDIHFTDRHGL